MADEFERKSHTIVKTSYLIVTGGLIGGFTFYGPFDKPSDTVKWALDNLKSGVPYHVHQLQDVRVA